MQSKEIDLDQIDINDLRYKFPDTSGNEDIKGSINRYSLLNPVKVMAGDKGFQVITGWKRVFACRELSLKRINSNVYSKGELTEEDVYKIIYLDNTHRADDLFKAELIKKLAESTGGVKDECLLDFLSFINLNPTKNNLQRYLRAASLEQRIKNSFSEKKLTFEQLVMLSEIEKEPDRSDIFNCFLKNFRFNNNETRDLIKDVLIISGREGVKISELYERICRNREKDLNKNELRKEIKRLCYPTLTDTENRFAKTADSLKLSGSTNILTHPYFESNELEIRIKFTEKEQLAGELEILSENINKGKIDKLLKIVKEGKES